GELWLRLAELQLASPHAGYREPGLRYARAISRMSSRAAELVPRWKEIGELELRTAGVDLDTLRAGAAQNRLWTAPSDAGPYELYRLAQISLEGNDPARASIYVRKLLEDVPGFLPGLDLALDAAEKLARTRDLIERLIKRIQAGGADERSDALLRSI